MSEKKEASHPQKEYKEPPEESDHFVEEKEHYEEEEDRVSVNIHSLTRVNYFSFSLSILLSFSFHFFLFSCIMCIESQRESFTKRKD